MNIFGIFFFYIMILIINLNIFRLLSYYYGSNITKPSPP
jgi:hypothetical protein